MLNQKHTRRFPTTELPALKNPRHEAFAQALTRGMSASAAREKVDQHNTGSPVYERIERVIVDHAGRSNDVRPSLSEPRNETENVIVEHAPQSK